MPDEQIIRLEQEPFDTGAVSLDELYAFLRRFNIYDSLYFISCINSSFKHGVRVLAEVDIPLPIKSWLAQLPKTSYRQIFLECSRLARFVLLSDAHNFGDKTLMLQDQSLIDAFNKVGMLFDKSVEVIHGEKPSLRKIVGRLTQWQFPLQSDRETLIGRAYLLFYQLPKEIPLEYSMDDKMKEYFQIGTFEFMATGMALFITTNGILDYELNVEIPYLKNIVSKENMIKFRDLSSGDVKDYKMTLRGVNWNTVNKLLDIYGLDPLIKMPCIKVGYSKILRDDTYLVPNAKYLLDRVSSGIFYILGDKEQEIAMRDGHQGRNPFRIMFGHLYREYVGRQLNQGHTSIEFIDLDKTPIAIKGKIPDFALKKDNVCILFEVKLSLLKLSSRTFYNESDLKAEVKSGNIKKAIEQLNDFREVILRKRIPHDSLSNIHTVYIILVGYEDIFVANSALLPLLKAEYGDLSKNFQLACISDIEAIGNALEKNEDIFGMLAQKIADPELEDWSIAPFLEEKINRDNKIVRTAFKSFINHLQYGI